MEDNNIYENNSVVIGGKLVEELVYSHEVYGEKFFEGLLETKRDSGAVDHARIIISEKILCPDLVKGSYVHVEGNIRTYNMQDNDNSSRRHLIIMIFVNNYTVLDCSTEKEYEENEVKLQGFICKAPVYRKTPLGRKIADVLIAVNRRYGKSAYIPCILWGRNAVYATTFNIGTEVVIKGRFQSRTYSKKLTDGTCEERTAYEISAKTIDPIENDNN